MRRMDRMKRMKRSIVALLLLLILCFGLYGCDSSDLDLAQSILESTEEILEETKEQTSQDEIATEEEKQDVTQEDIKKEVEQEDNENGIPKYKGKPYVQINNNKPTFKDSELKTTSYETYSKLDKLGRCGVARANIGKDIMPKEERGSIGRVKPSGWQTIKYDNVNGKYLYNRCHLIGFQLAGENANEKNLITGTRYLNVEGMLPFENMVAEYVEETSNHVLYQVRPLFEGDNLLATGVYMEAKSVEDKGKGISFNIFVFNVQPGIKIDYSDGSSTLE